MYKRFLLSIALMLFAAFSAEAQQPGRVPRISYLSGASGPGPREETFCQGLRELGYIEGKDILIEWHHAAGQGDRLATLANEVVRLKVDVIVTDGTRLTGAAKNATRTIPIVMTSDADPIGMGYVASLARPGGNITGLTNNNSELSGKRLEVLKEGIPGRFPCGSHLES